MGIVARDSEGTVLLSFSKIYHQVVSAYAAEAIAYRAATRIGINMQWPKIIIERDALVVIKKCKGRNRDRSMIGAYIHDIQQLLISSVPEYAERLKVMEKEREPD